MGNSEFYRIQNLIDGEWIEEKGGEYVPLYNPSTGETIGEVPRSSKETTLAAVESSYRAYDEWRNQPLSKRVGYLFEIRKAMQD